MIDSYQEGDVVEMKKEHPCHKAKTWHILRVGADVKLKCDGCGAVILLERHEFERKCKRRIETASERVETI